MVSKKIVRLGGQGIRSGELTKQPFFCLWQPQKKANQRKGAKGQSQSQGQKSPLVPSESELFFLKNKPLKFKNNKGEIQWLQIQQQQ